MLIAIRDSTPPVTVQNANVRTATAERSSIGDGWERAWRTAAMPATAPSATSEAPA